MKGFIFGCLCCMSFVLPLAALSPVLSHCGIIRACAFGAGGWGLHSLAIADSLHSHFLRNRVSKQGELSWSAKSKSKSQSKMMKVN